MYVDTLEIDVTKVKTWDDFHNAMQEVFGFPDFYGRNMNAWIDCLTSLDEPEDGMTKVHVEKGKVMVLRIKGISGLKKDMREALIEDAAFVNYRRLEVGEPAVLALSFWRKD